MQQLTTVLNVKSPPLHDGPSNFGHRQTINQLTRGQKIMEQYCNAKELWSCEIFG
jgi:hypothetical protein